MAHTKQALKRARQSAALNAKNRAQRSAMKTQLKKVDAALAAGDPAKIADELRLAQKHLDKAAKRRVIHPNAAARRKSRLATRAAEAVKAKKA
ncbi:MAG TPA: 30S ribosomal protein S20 [Planctomycetota bacterium]|nr:30S ribosomal protein S20 [Planctomycetota bacterium]